jgi:hypothetical protein
MKPKGFVVPGGYMGLMPNGKYQIFDTEKEYTDYIEEKNNEMEIQDRPRNRNNGKKRGERNA